MTRRTRRGLMLAAALWGLSVAPAGAQGERPDRSVLVPGRDRGLPRLLHVDQIPDSAVPVGGRLREARLQGLNGRARALSSYRGRPLLINVWASWCGPCRAEAASLEQLAWSPLGSQFVIIGISTDDYVENAQGWLKQSNATITHYIDQHLQMEHMLGADHLPLTVLVDAQGRVLDKFRGARDWSSPEAAADLRRAFHLPAR